MTHESALSLELDVYLILTFVNILVTPLPFKFNHCLVTSLHSSSQRLDLSSLSFVAPLLSVDARQDRVRRKDKNH